MQKNTNNLDPDLKNNRVAVIASDGFEETELTSPVQALREHGIEVDIISLKPIKIQAYKHHEKTIQVAVDKVIERVKPEEYGALVLPGGALNADFLRTNDKVQKFVKAIDAAGKPLAVICHAPWILVSAGLVKGRTLTSYETIKDDIVNAGATWIDEEVVVDNNWVTSRSPDDLPAFTRELLRLISERGINRKKAA